MEARRSLAVVPRFKLNVFDDLLPDVDLLKLALPLHSVPAARIPVSRARMSRPPQSYKPIRPTSYLVPPTSTTTTTNTRPQRVAVMTASRSPPTPPIFSPSSEAPIQSRLSLHGICRCHMKIMRERAGEQQGRSSMRVGG
ncbi:hypothetical protein P171DRAFT_435709 [Karstenula rhodostoma CBS 690.94]|uniref:Uncharacterized protein n=1 Tax=Karstenula rhodostoma CBS 690.94 TaxID=1392251 RepID=A0A9P4U859_9PLEO|nr:hypothetical protein P171DRAFT_435709 [Karstenula rhodostoma CBS 690.94]